MATLQDDTQARLTQIEPDIRRLARVLCLGQRDAQEDLAQVGRLAIWQKLQRQPGAPEPLLQCVAKRAMIDSREQGRSVDGRLDPVTRRAFRWLIGSLDAPQRESQGPLTNGLASDALDGFHALSLWGAPTEDEALGRVLYAMLRGILTPREDAVLTLLLVGYPYRHVERLLHLTPKEVEWSRRQLQKKLAQLTDGGPRPIKRGPAKPFHVAPEIAALLSELLEVIRQC
jgi:DNA-directed RNA polymerase specialized sigma24 family protein